MDPVASSTASAAPPAAAPWTDDDSAARWPITDRAARHADDRLAAAVARTNATDVAGDERRRAARDDDGGGIPISSGTVLAAVPSAARETTRAHDSAASSPAPPAHRVVVAPPGGDTAPSGGAASASPDGAAARDLRAWDDARPKHDDIAAWRWHDGAWRWEDALDRHAPPPAWSRPWFTPPTEDFRVPLDSALALQLFRGDATSARTIAPGVMAHVAAALSRGDLAATSDARDLVPLMQRMTVDHQLDVAQGSSALREHGAPVDAPPYATRIARMATTFEDGTNNHVDDPAEFGGTNVAGMYKLMAIEHAIDPRVPAPHYHGGVGNRYDWNPVMRVFGAAFGAGMDDIQKKSRREFDADLRAGITDFANFGFSRGAAGTMDTVNGYVDVAAGRAYDERFVGLFDTVSAMDGKIGGTGHLRLQPPRGAGAPDVIYHAISQDERRVRFPLVDVGDAGLDRVIKDRFPGVHSDAGGGYANKGLSNIVLHRMIENAQRAGVPMPSVEEVVATAPDYASRVLAFLHQDHDEQRHLENRVPFVLDERARRLPNDSRRSEFAIAHIERHAYTAPVRFRDRDLDRRATSDAVEERRIEISEVEPTGRFRYSAADPVPRPASAPRPPQEIAETTREVARAEGTRR